MFEQLKDKKHWGTYLIITGSIVTVFNYRGIQLSTSNILILLLTIAVVDSMMHYFRLQ